MDLAGPRLLVWYISCWDREISVVGGCKTPCPLPPAGGALFIGGRLKLCSRQCGSPRVWRRAFRTRDFPLWKDRRRCRGMVLTCHGSSPHTNDCVPDEVPGRVKTSPLRNQYHNSDDHSPSPSSMMGRGLGGGAAHVIGYGTGGTMNLPAPKGTSRNALIERCAHASPTGA